MWSLMDKRCLISKASCARVSSVSGVKELPLFEEAGILTTAQLPRTGSYHAVQVQLYTSQGQLWLTLLSHAQVQGLCQASQGFIPWGKCPISARMSKTGRKNWLGICLHFLDQKLFKTFDLLSKSPSSQLNFS